MLLEKMLLVPRCGVGEAGTSICANGLAAGCCCCVDCGDVSGVIDILSGDCAGPDFAAVDPKILLIG